MAFLFPNKKSSELKDIEIIEDVLLTQNKIESTLRGVLAQLEDEEYGKKAMDRYYPTSLSGYELAHTFFKAVHVDHKLSLKDELKDFARDITQIYRIFEYFQFPPVSDIVINGCSPNEHMMLRKRHREYNDYVMPYYSLFMKSNEEIVKLVFGATRKKLAPRKLLEQPDYDKLKMGDIVALTYASYGAMGEPGVMNIVTKYLDVFGIGIDRYAGMGNKFNLAYKFNVHNMPPMRLMTEGECDAMDGWYAFYTGFGNTLFIRKKYLHKFKEYIMNNLSKNHRCSALYVKRFEAIEYAILSTRE